MTNAVMKEEEYKGGQITVNPLLDEVNILVFREVPTWEAVLKNASFWGQICLSGTFYIHFKYGGNVGDSTP